MKMWGVTRDAVDRAVWVGWGAVRVGFWKKICPGRGWWHLARGTGYMNFRLWRFAITVDRSREG